MSGERRAGDGPRRSIMLVAYFHPPSRDTGALRPAAMAKYLRRLGHEVTVLTTSAYGDLPDDREQAIVRTADAQRWRARLHGKEHIDALFDSDTYSGRPHPLSRVVVPEPLALAWAPFARAAARRLARSRSFDCVITTSPPESAHGIGATLQGRGLPWLADVRDAWTFEPLRPAFPTAAQRRLDAWLERRRLGAADAVVCVSRPAAADLRARLGIEPLIVPNGWDPEGAPQAPPPASGPGQADSPLDPERVSLLYTGRFGGYGRDPRPLLAALERLAAEDPEVAARLELVVAGPLTDEEQRLLREARVAPARVLAAGSLPRARALELQREADVLLLLASARRTQLANYKLFEYMAAGRPILALASGTEAGRIVAEAGGEVVRSDDPAAIAAALSRLVAGELPALDPHAHAVYSYPAVAERMAAAVEAAIARRRALSRS